MTDEKIRPWHDVTVHWPDGTSHQDGIRGHDQADALANAEWNWTSAYGTAERIEYHGLSAEQDGRAR